MTTRTRPEGTPGDSPGAEAMPSWVEPQLATLTRERFSDPAWIFERKLDGERCLACAGHDGVRLMSRSRHEITTTFPEIATARTCDGELRHPRFQGLRDDKEPRDVVRERPS